MKLKLKVKKAALKRIIIKKDNFYRKKAYKAHLLRRKSKKQLRNLSKKTLVRHPDKKVISLMIPYL